MSRIGDALKRAGAPDIADGLLDMPLADHAVASQFDSVATPPVSRAPALDPDQELPLENGPVVGDRRELAAETFNGSPIRPDSRLVVNPDLPAIAVEQYRRLAATLHHIQEDRGVKRVIVSSAVANEGKTLTSVNLALTLSQSYAKRVLLIDADLRRPRVNVVFGLSSGPGLSEALDRREPRKLPVAQVSPLLSILPAGKATPDPMAGLTSSRMAAILDDASEQFDFVIIDTPPVGLLSDARLLASMADVALIVVGSGTTPCGAVQRAIDSIGRERVLGIVLNRADETLARGGEYHYYYGYYGNTDHRNGNGGGLLSRLLGRR
jgi:capsular exopolysaccharide synthesis family protein